LDPLEAAKEAVRAAREAGAGSADAIGLSFRETRLLVRRGELETSQESETRGVGVRAFREGRTGVSYTTDASPAGLRRAGREAADLAAAASPDEAAGLPAAADRGAPAAIEGIDDEAFDSLTPEEGLRRALAGESAAFAEDRRIVNSQGSSFRASRSTVALAASDGFEASYRKTRFGLEVTVLAEDAGGALQRDGWWTADTALRRLDPAESVGREAARRTVRRLGWRKVETRAVPVVLAPDVAASLAAEVARACCGDALVRGASFLADSLGKPVASPLLTLVDDPGLPGRLGSRPFDGEGARTSRKVLFEAGVLRSFLFDSWSLRKLAREHPERARGGTAGNAARGLGGTTSPGTTNLFVEPGTSNPGDLIAGVGDGFYVRETMGFGVNPVTGDYSKGAAGLWIRDGRLDHAVQEVTIAGDLRAMLLGVDGVADDLEFRAECAAPTIRIARMTVSGS